MAPCWKGRGGVTPGQVAANWSRRAAMEPPSDGLEEREDASRSRTKKTKKTIGEWEKASYWSEGQF